MFADGGRHLLTVKMRMDMVLDMDRPAAVRDIHRRGVHGVRSMREVALWVVARLPKGRLIRIGLVYEIVIRDRLSTTRRRQSV